MQSEMNFFVIKEEKIVLKFMLKLICFENYHSLSKSLGKSKSKIM